MIQEKLKASQIRKKSYHDKRRKDIEFQVKVYVFFRVILPYSWHVFQLIYVGFSNKKEMY